MSLELANARIVVLNGYCTEYGAEILEGSCKGVIFNIGGNHLTGEIIKVEFCPDDQFCRKVVESKGTVVERRIPRWVDEAFNDVFKKIQDELGWIESGDDASVWFSGSELSRLQEQVTEEFKEYARYEIDLDVQRREEYIHVIIETRNDAVQVTNSYKDREEAAAAFCEMIDNAFEDLDAATELQQRFAQAMEDGSFTCGETTVYLQEIALP